MWIVSVKPEKNVSKLLIDIMCACHKCFTEPISACLLIPIFAAPRKKRRQLSCTVEPSSSLLTAAYLHIITLIPLNSTPAL